MKKRVYLVASVVLFILSLSHFLHTVRPEQTTLEWTVKEGESIQQAINNASEGDTIIIESGVHREGRYPIIVNKTVTLKGRNAENVIIDGQGTSCQIFLIKAASAEILKLTIQNTGNDSGAAGIHLSHVRNVKIAECIIKSSFTGIQLENATSCTIIRNEIKNNYAHGIYLRSGSSLNLITSNTISNNPTGIFVADIDSRENKIYHNNFVNNTSQKGGVGIGGSWDNGYPSGGNYWSNYIGVDLKSGPQQDQIGSDGIYDYPNWLDNYPLTGKIYFFNAYEYNNISHYIMIASNSSISDFKFTLEYACVEFNVTGFHDGFCRVTIPKQLLWVEKEENWTVIINNETARNVKIMCDNDHTYVYINYTKGDKVIKIKGDHAIPEYFSTVIILKVGIFLSLLSAILKKKANGMKFLNQS